MRFSRFAHVIPVSLVLALPLFLASNGAAQQITYYDFNAPQANPSQYSYSCGTLPVPSPLFCLNNYYGQTVSPSFISDFFPASIDPTGGSGSNQYATLMTQPTTEHERQQLEDETIVLRQPTGDERRHTAGEFLVQ